MLHLCALCGDPTDTGDDWCASCSIDIEMEIDEMLDGQKPETD